MPPLRLKPPAAPRDGLSILRLRHVLFPRTPPLLRQLQMEPPPQSLPSPVLPPPILLRARPPRLALMGRSAHQIILLSLPMGRERPVWACRLWQPRNPWCRLLSVRQILQTRGRISPPFPPAPPAPPALARALRRTAMRQFPCPPCHLPILLCRRNIPACPLWKQLDLPRQRPHPLPQYGRLILLPRLLRRPRQSLRLLPLPHSKLPHSKPPHSKPPGLRRMKKPPMMRPLNS